MRTAIIALLLLLSLITSGFSQDTLLNRGDIAIIGFQSDNNDEFAFLCLVDIPAATKIQFSEKGWDGSLPIPAFATTTEGIHTWTAPATGVPKGTAIVISFNSTGTNPQASVGSVVSSAAAKLSTAGDEILAYQGTFVNPRFLYAFGSRSWITTGTPTSTQSWLPNSLINGYTARDFTTEMDDEYFNLTHMIANKDSILSAVGNPKNWLRSNTRFTSFPNWQLNLLTNFYLKPKANPSMLINWGTSFDGTGNYPIEFLDSASIFHIYNQNEAIEMSDNWTVNQLMLHENQILSINDFHLQISNLIDSSKGCLRGSKNTQLTINGKSGPILFDSNFSMLHHFSLSKNASASIISSLKIVNDKEAGTISLGDSSILNSNGFLTLTADENFSAALTALGTDANLTGAVEVQQFIPPGKRNYRFLSHPFANSIALNQLSSDIDITGINGSLNGFTSTQTNNPSAFWYDPIIADSNHTELGWTAFTNTNGLGNNAWLPKQGIRMNIRGSKGQGLQGENYHPSAVYLHIKGSLNLGDQKVCLYRNNENAGFNLIGNPYAATIDMSKLILEKNILPNYYLWDPWLGKQGGYSCFPFSNSFYLPAFSAFFAQTTDTVSENHIIIPELAKIGNPPSLQVLDSPSKTNNLLEIWITDDSIVWDKTMIIFKSNCSDSLDYGDAKKMMNSDFSLFTTSADGYPLCIDNRSDHQNCKIPLDFRTGLRQQFFLNLKKIPSINGYDIFLLDKQTDKKIALKSTLIYAFNIEANSISDTYNRFEIHLTNNQTFNNNIETNKLQVWCYPNPVNNQLLLKIQTPSVSPISVKIINVSGKILLQEKITASEASNHSINFQNWSSGIYFLKIDSEKESITKKLIKN